MLYLWLKVIHVISSTILFGTGLGTAYFMYRAHLTRDIHAIAYATKGAVFADWVFTTPSGIVQPMSGIAMALLAHYSLTSPWLLYSIILYLVALGCWLPVVWLQIKIKDMAELAQLTQQPLPPSYYRYMRYWFMLGWPAFIALIIVFYLMVFKPI